jgi:hypothetical protein
LDTADKNKYQIAAEPVEFEITCSTGDKTAEVSQFGAFVERVIAIPQDVDPSRITTGVVLNSDGTFSHVPTAISSIAGVYYARINSLTDSAYLLIHNAKTFGDVGEHWANEAVGDMASRLVVEGVNEDQFMPDNGVMRAEFTQILVNALGLMRPGAGKNLFPDVTRGAWYYDAVSIAREYDLISGCDDGKFRLDDTISREQAMAITARAMRITGLREALPEDEINGVLEAFADADKSAAYEKAVSPPA